MKVDLWKLNCWVSLVHMIIAVAVVRQNRTTAWQRHQAARLCKTHIKCPGVVCIQRYKEWWGAISSRGELSFGFCAIKYGSISTYCKSWEICSAICTLCTLCQKGAAPRSCLEPRHVILGHLRRLHTGCWWPGKGGRAGSYVHMHVHLTGSLLAVHRQRWAFKSICSCLPSGGCLQGGKLLLFNLWNKESLISHYSCFLIS